MSWMKGCAGGLCVEKRKGKQTVYPLAAAKSARLEIAADDWHLRDLEASGEAEHTSADDELLRVPAENWEKRDADRSEESALSSDEPHI